MPRNLSACIIPRTLTARAFLIDEGGGWSGPGAALTVRGNCERGGDVMSGSLDRYGAEVETYRRQTEQVTEVVERLQALAERLTVWWNVAVPHQYPPRDVDRPTHLVEGPDRWASRTDLASVLVAWDVARRRAERAYDDLTTQERGKIAAPWNPWR